MEKFVKRTWAEVNINNIKHNFRKIKNKLNPKTKLLCVLKADAYGHGSEFLVREYEKMGADFFGVSNLDEAMQLRKAGAHKPILIFGYTPSECADILANNSISQTVFSLEYAKQLQIQCKNKGVNIKAHIKIDTGMSRIGFFAQNEESRKKSINEILEINNMPEIEIEGMFTHFSVADDTANEKNYTLMQINNFKNIINSLESKKLHIPLKHCCNSGGMINFPDMHLDMVRAGIILYGLYPSEEIAQKISLKPSMSLKTVISQIKIIPKGTSVSYGRTFVADKEIKIASVAIGYADGYSIKFSNNSEMIVRGKRSKVLGRVCMDQLMLDVSDVDGVREGDVVTVFGGDDENYISVDELAKNIGTINYEIVCLIGKRVPRVYFENGEIVGNVSYI